MERVVGTHSAGNAVIIDSITRSIAVSLSLVSSKVAWYTREDTRIPWILLPSSLAGAGELEDGLEVADMMTMLRLGEGFGTLVVVVVVKVRVEVKNKVPS